MYLSLFLFAAIYSSSSFGVFDFTNCDLNKCYQTVNNSHKHFLSLIEKFGKTTSQAKVPKIYDVTNLENDIENVKRVKNKIEDIKIKLEDSGKKVNQTGLGVFEDQKRVNHLFEVLSNISKYNISVNRILKEARDNQTTFEKLLEESETTEKICKQAEDQYSELRSIIDDIVEEYDIVSKSHDDASNRVKSLNKNLNTTFKETIDLRDRFEELKLPINVVEDYLSKTETSLNRTIDDLKEDVDLMKDLLEDSQRILNAQLLKKFNTAAEEIAKLQGDIDKMTEEVDKYERAFTGSDFQPTVDKVSRDFLEQIKNKIVALETKIKLLDFSEVEKVLLADYKDDQKHLEVIREERERLKKLHKILDSVPQTEEELLEIQQIIDELRERVDLFEKWKYLKRELELQRVHRDEIVKINCTGQNGLLT